MKFSVAGGPESVHLGSFAVDSVYGGASEGTPEGLTRLYRGNGLAEAVIRRYRSWDPLPVQVIDPGSPALPPFQCVAYFKYWEAGCRRDLLVSWFVPDLDLAVRAAVEAILPAVEWSLARSISPDDE